jgi:hypothetical protein
LFVNIDLNAPMLTSAPSLYWYDLLSNPIITSM